jgi:hypothetical protein
MATVSLKGAWRTVPAIGTDPYPTATYLNITAPQTAWLNPRLTVTPTDMKPSKYYFVFEGQADPPRALQWGTLSGTQNFSVNNFVGGSLAALLSGTTPIGNDLPMTPSNVLNVTENPDGSLNVLCSRTGGTSDETFSLIVVMDATPTE